MRCMIISQRATFHARLTVKWPHIYLTIWFQPHWLYIFTIYGPGIPSRWIGNKNTTLLMYIWSHRACSQGSVHLVKQQLWAFPGGTEIKCSSALSRPPHKQLGQEDGSKKLTLDLPAALLLSTRCSLLCAGNMRWCSGQGRGTRARTQKLIWTMKMMLFMAPLCRG